MTKSLFDEFDAVSAKQWKQKIQFELKGAEYNDAVVWNSPEEIKVKPFYNSEDEVNTNIPLNTAEFNICQNIFVYDLEKSIKRTLDVLNRGADSIRFSIDNPEIDIVQLLEKLPLEGVTIYFNLGFLSLDFVVKIYNFTKSKAVNVFYNTDPIGFLAREGNWYQCLEKDNFETLIEMNKVIQNQSFISVDAALYQNAGATIVQQIAYGLAHANEYFNRIDNKSRIVIQIAIGSNYFFEIAKIRAIKKLYQVIAIEYGFDTECHIIATPTKRNKTIYDYNVNMLRTTSECMSAIIGGANAIANLPYDALYHKDNEFGDRIARNQLLILKHESHLGKVFNPADGAYYIENITQQLSEKALVLFKDIEKNGGFLKQLNEGIIKRKIQESAEKEQTLFDDGKEVLLGTNKYPNLADAMKNDLELFPFVKVKPRKTLITPIIEKRLAEKIEQNRLEKE